MARTALRTAPIAIILLGFALITTPSQAAKPHFRQADRHVDAPIEQVWAVLEDLSQWQSFTPGLQSLAVERTGADTAHCRFEIETLGFAIAYSADVRFDRANGQIHVTLDDGAERDIEALHSTWTLEAGPDGSTHVALASHFRSGMPVPGFFERRALGKSLDQTLDALSLVIEQMPAAERAAPIQVAAAR